MHEDQGVFETIINDFLQDDFAVVTGFVSGEILRSLNANLVHLLASGKMNPAGIGQRNKYQQNQEIRRDLISWIEEKEGIPSELSYLAVVQKLIMYLNETCYTGLLSAECHYAWFDTGSFYSRHLDQFRADTGRKYSIILYLNDNWLESDGGHLVLFKGESEIRILPEGGRFVFFQSDMLEHEVLAASRPRMSVTGWLKNI